MSGYDDDDLLARLRAADPAASLPPADPEQVADLLEATMSDTRTDESRDTGTHDRSPLTWLVAAAAVLLIVATSAFALAHRDHGTTAAATPTVTSLQATPSDTLCLQPNVRVLRLQTVAFRGRLTSTDPSDGTATFDVTEWFRGGPTDLVRVTTPDAGLEGQMFLGGLVRGRTYLVAAHAGLVTGCGFTGPDTPARAALFEQAFGG